MWHIQKAAVTGKGHISENRPCQDKVFSMEDGGVTAIALADGAGSAPLSQEGAACAVATACRILCSQFDELTVAASPLAMRMAIMEPVCTAIAQRATELECDSSALACTLLAVAVKENQYLIFHVGDGVIGYQKAGKLMLASAPQNGEFANTTTFITSPEAMAKSRAFRGTQELIEGFVLMSDGCEASLYQKQRRRLAPLIGRMMQWAEMLGGNVCGELLNTAMQQTISARTQDDCSIALLTRKTKTFGHWAALTQREQAQVLGVSSQRHSRTRRQIRRYAKLWQAGGEPVSAETAAG